MRDKDLHATPIEDLSKFLIGKEHTLEVMRNGIHPHTKKKRKKVSQRIKDIKEAIHDKTHDLSSLEIDVKGRVKDS